MNKRRAARRAAQASAEPAVASQQPVARTGNHLRWEALLLLLVVFLIYIASPVIATGDSHFVIPAALSIIRHGDANIDEYVTRFSEAPWALRVENGHAWNVYPIGVPLLVLPLVWIWDKSAALGGIDLEAAIIRKYPGSMDLCLASLITAGAVAFLFYYCRRRLSLPRALVLAFLFAFGTSAYSSASRGLWQHGPSMLFFLAALLIYELLPKHGFPALLSLGIVCGYSYGVRPGSLQFIVGFAVLVALETPRGLVPYLLGVSAGLAPMLTYNRIAFGTWSSHYYRLVRDYFLNAHWQPVVYYDVLFSPSRGLFVFSPFLLYAGLRLSGAYRRRYPWTRVEVFLGILCLAGWISVGSWPQWWGGGSYGPRLLCELSPCMLILLIPVAQELSLEGTARKRLATAVFVIAGSLGIALHLRGAAAWAANNDWNMSSPDINSAPQRARSWQDPQFLHGWGAVEK
jgi:hypothetical protein